MAVAGLYRRILPSPPAIEFSSSEGKTQSEPAYCGLASLSVVLNALAIDPGRKWKGPWRWFDESMLDCCEPLERVKAEGITFGKVACLAHCAGAKVEAFHTTQSNIDDFRSHVKKCATSEDCHLIASYHRKPFKQTGTGHFSPIGGYHAGRDMALVLDVARFKYPPHWVPVSLLWEAMDTVDEATGRPRGFMLISRLQAPPLLYTLSCKHESWASTAKFLTVDVPILLKSDDLKTVPGVLSVIFQSLPAHAGDFIKWIAEVRRQDEDGSSLSKEEKARIAAKEEVLKQVHETKLFKYVTDWLSSARSQFENLPAFGDKDSLTEIAANVCCQGAEILTGCHGAKAGFYCKKTCVTCLKSNGDNTTAIISGTVISGHNEQGVDILLPSSPKKQTGHCTLCPANVIVTHPASNDILTVLLLALPFQTWTGLKDQKLLSEIQAIVSDENLPVVLREEVLLLRRQLHFLKRCKDNEVENDCQMP